MKSSIVVFATVSLGACLLWSPKLRGDESQSHTHKVPMKTRITPFLMFEGRAEEAMKFYVSLFPDAKIVTAAVLGGGGKAGVEQAGDQILVKVAESDRKEPDTVVVFTLDRPASAVAPVAVAP